MVLEKAVHAWQFYHMALFASWLLATMITADQPAWFLAGSLGFSTLCMAVAVFVIPMTRTAALRQLDEVRQKVQALGHERYKEIVTMLDNARPPLISKHCAMALLTVALLGLVPVAWYFANAIRARTGTYNSTYTQLLAYEMWHREPGSTIAMLVLLSLTALMHAIDIVVASIVLAKGCSMHASAEL